jgi:hypothetical protein
VTHATVHRGDEILHVYTPTDVVRDRLIHFWAWGDYNGLRVALDVATKKSSHGQIANFTRRRPLTTAFGANCSWPTCERS